MPGYYTLGQLGLSLAVLALIVERGRALLQRAPASAKATKWLGQRLTAGETASALAWARLRPNASVSKLLIGQLDAEDGFPESLDLAQRELRIEAAARLDVLRGAATLASVSGLLGGILAIVNGFNDDSLLALQAGLAQRVAIGQALQSMGIGVGTSAVCFYALSVFRGALRELHTQVAHIAHILSLRGASPLGRGGNLRQ